jgi:hypothetical protein
MRPHRAPTPRSARTRLVLAAAAAALTLFAVTSLAGATQTRRWDSFVTLSTTNPFHGHVTSVKHACEVDRKVKIFHVQAGPDGLFGTATTNNNGGYSRPATPSGNFYAKVKRREEGGAGTIFICRSDRSQTRHF